MNKHILHKFFLLFAMCLVSTSIQIQSTKKTTMVNLNEFIQSDHFSPKNSIQKLLQELKQNIQENWDTIYKNAVNGKSQKNFENNVLKHVKRGAQLYLDTVEAQKKKKLSTFLKNIKETYKTQKDWQIFFADLLWFFYAYQNFFSISPIGPEKYAVVMPTTRDALGKSFLEIFSYLSTNETDGKYLAKIRNQKDLKNYSGRYLPQFETQALYTSDLFAPEEEKSMLSFFGLGKKAQQKDMIILPNNDQNIIFKYASPKNDPNQKLYLLSPQQNSLSIAKRSPAKNPLLDAREILPKEFQTILSMYINNPNDAKKPLFELKKDATTKAFLLVGLQGEIVDDLGETPPVQDLLIAIALPSSITHGEQQIGSEINTQAGELVLELFAKVISEEDSSQDKIRTLYNFRENTQEYKRKLLLFPTQELKGLDEFVKQSEKIFSQIKKDDEAEKKRWESMQKELLQSLESFSKEATEIIETFTKKLEDNNITTILEVTETRNAAASEEMQNFKKNNPKQYKAFEELFNTLTGIMKLTELRTALPNDFTFAKKIENTLYSEMLKIAKTLYTEQNVHEKNIKKTRKEFSKTIEALSKQWSLFKAEIERICKKNSISFTQGENEKKLLQEKVSELKKLTKNSELSQEETNMIDTYSKTVENYWGFYKTPQKMELDITNLYNSVNKQIENIIIQAQKQFNEKSNKEYESDKEEEEELMSNSEYESDKEEDEEENRTFQQSLYTSNEYNKLMKKQGKTEEPFDATQSFFDPSEYRKYLEENRNEKTSENIKKKKDLPSFLRNLLSDSFFQENTNETNKSVIEIAQEKEDKEELMGNSESESDKEEDEEEIYRSDNDYVATEEKEEDDDDNDNDTRENKQNEEDEEFSEIPLD